MLEGLFLSLPEMDSHFQMYFRQSRFIELQYLDISVCVVAGMVL
jgi:hypothetical protein